MANFLFTIIIYPITQILEFSFNLSQKLFRETGISVIFISLTTSVLCLPLYTIAEKWQQHERKITKNLKSKIDKIKAVYKGDERYMILSTYYRQNHYHPIYALRGSFGLFIQIPFFIAAYSYLSHLELLKNVPFFFIRDLGSPDALFSIKGFAINLLPFVMTFINCLSGTIYTKNLPVQDKIQLYGMAGIFLILLYNSPAALVMYWTMNNVFSLLKNIYYRLHMGHKRLFLLSLFSAACILLATFCVAKYYYISKARKLVSVCIFAAVVPWIYFIFKNRLSKILDIRHERDKSLSIFLLSAFLIWMLLGVFIPSQLIVSSPQEFSFIDEYTNPLFFIFITAVQVFGMFVFWPVCLFFLFSDNAKKYFSMFFLIITAAMLINVFLFPGNYGLISINFVYDHAPGHSNLEILFNLFVMLLLFAVVFFLFKLKNKNIIPVFLYICIFSLFCTSAVNIYRSNATFYELKTYYVKEQKKPDEILPIFSLSQNGKNIVVIMLDRAISVFIPFIFEESPELSEAYSGFTFYPNTVSFNGYTAIGAPPLYGGYEYSPQETNKRKGLSLAEKHNQALLVMPRIFSENGFFVCVTDPPYANLNWKSDLSIFDALPDIRAYITDSHYTDLWLNEHNLKLPETSDIIKRNMFWYSLLKGLPLLFRQPVYMDGSKAA